MLHGFAVIMDSPKDDYLLYGVQDMGVLYKFQEDFEYSCLFGSRERAESAMEAYSKNPFFHGEKMEVVRV